MIDISNELRKEIISYIENKKLYQKYFMEYIHLKTIRFCDIDFVSYDTEDHYNEGRYSLQIRADHRAKERYFRCQCILRKDGSQQYKIDGSKFEYEILPKNYIAEIFDTHFNDESIFSVQMRIPFIYFPLGGNFWLRIGCDTLKDRFPNICTRVVSLKRNNREGLSEDIQSNLNYDVSILPILFDMIEDNMISNIEEIESIYHNMTDSYLDLENQPIETYRTQAERLIMTKKALEEMTYL